MALPTHEYVKGFPEFSEFLGSCPDLVVFRRFDAISSRNLLYMQAELIELEKLLKNLDDQDQIQIQSGHDMECQLASRDWSFFLDLAKENETQKEKLRVIREIRRVLHEYHDALDRYRRVLGMDSPSNHILSILKEFMDKRDSFTGSSSLIFNNPRDIIGLRPVVDQDRFSSSISALFGYFFREQRETPESWPQNYYFSEHGGIARMTSIICVLLATALLFGAIVALNFVLPSYHGIRLGIIGLFTTAFAVIVGMFTNAKRSELFTGVATYSAVLVVFSTINVES